MEYKLNDAELAILLLIAENSTINGYQLKQLANERGLQAWAGVSASSIYVILKKLEMREFVISRDDAGKQSRGPRGQVFKVTDLGTKTLLRNLRDALSQTREHRPRYNIALSGEGLLSRPQFLQCSKARRDFLEKELERLTLISTGQSDQTRAAGLLFQRILNGLNAEIDWMTAVIAECEQQEG